MKSIQVLGETYRLKLVSGLIEREGCEGYCDPYSYTIVIDKALMKNKRIFRRVLLHELCHAFAIEAGLHEFMSGQSLEMFCQTMSSFIDKLHLPKGRRR